MISRLINLCNQYPDLDSDIKLWIKLAKIDCPISWPISRNRLIQEHDRAAERAFPDFFPHFISFQAVYWNETLIIPDQRELSLLKDINIRPSLEKLSSLH